VAPSAPLPPRIVFTPGPPPHKPPGQNGVLGALSVGSIRVASTGQRQRLLLLAELDVGEEALSRAAEVLELDLVAQSHRAEEQEAQREALGLHRVALPPLCPV
jgi:hypothetical protein